MRKPSRALARRYAQALLDLTGEKGKGKPAPDQLQKELDEAQALLSAQGELASVLAHPGVGLEKKKKIAAAVWGKRKASGLFLRLLDLLLARHRLALLAVVAEVYRELRNAARGVVGAEVLTATPLEAKQKGSLATALARVSGLEVELQGKEDPSVLGGVLVRMGGRTYDGTVRAQLRALRQRLAGA